MGHSARRGRRAHARRAWRVRGPCIGPLRVGCVYEAEPNAPASAAGSAPSAAAGGAAAASAAAGSAGASAAASPAGTAAAGSSLMAQR